MRELPVEMQEEMVVIIAGTPFDGCGESRGPAAAIMPSPPNDGLSAIAGRCAAHLQCAGAADIGRRGRVRGRSAWGANSAGPAPPSARPARRAAHAAFDQGGTDVRAVRFQD